MQKPPIITAESLALIQADALRGIGVSSSTTLRLVEEMLYLRSRLELCVDAPYDKDGEPNDGITGRNITINDLGQQVHKSALRIKELDLTFGRQLLALRAAVIEMQHGAGAEEAMKWIWNTLAGPGELPPEDATDAQEYFDREIEAVDEGLAQVVAQFMAAR